MSAPRLALLGTSRLHRCFARRQSDGTQWSVPTEQLPVFLRLGYFHAAAEAAQIAELLAGTRDIPSSLLPFVFRAENKVTTPLNEFDPLLSVAIRKAKAFQVQDPSALSASAAIVIEVSSLRANRHRATGTVLHSNPNWLHDVAYADIYPDGYYAKFFPWLDVSSELESVEQLADDFNAVQRSWPDRPLIVIGHLASRQSPGGQRLKQNELVQSAANQAGAHYLDVGPFLDEFGFAQTDAGPDRHHLCPDGESALGQALIGVATRHLIGPGAVA